MQCVWFRQDLRVIDNTALNSACEGDESVIAVYVLTPETWRQHHKAAVQVEFILRALQSLRNQLAELNIPLKILEVNKYSDVPIALTHFCEQHSVQQLHANKQYLLDEIKRDQQVQSALTKINIPTQFYDDAYLLPPMSVTKKDGTPYKVFTPYKREFLNRLSLIEILPTPAKRLKNDIKADMVPNKLAGFSSDIDPARWPANEKAALDQLEQFVQQKVLQYKDDRDFPSVDGTSQLSVYLAQGILSVRQCAVALMSLLGEDLKSLQAMKGPECWFSELIWREFYAMIARSFPQVVKHQPLQAYTDNLPWRTDETLFQAWCDGNTGFPFVDAAMRQLNQTGWMHNRLRMVVAMFFTKTLFLDWRLGEQYFMQRLIDGDFASNNGGWQWSASTGTDAVPYFRIFNPTAQSEKFDSAGQFIRQYCPELNDLSDKGIHNPNAFERASCDYPEPIVNYSEMRKMVIEAFKSAKGSV